MTSHLLPATPAALAETVRVRLAEMADADAGARMQAYMKSAMPFRGVPTKPLSALCREVFGAGPLATESDWHDAVLDLWDGAGYREERYAAIALAGHRAYADYRTPRALGIYHHLVVTGAWWDLVDSVAAPLVGPLLRTHPGEVAATVRRWAVDDDLWVRRTAILCQLNSRTATDTGLLRECLSANLLGSRHGEEFFIRKALGWALREHAKTDEAWVRAFVAEHDDELAPLTRREALKHLA